MSDSVAALGVGKAWRPNIPEADGVISAEDSAMLVGAYIPTGAVTTIPGFLHIVRIYVAWGELDNPAN